MYYFMAVATMDDEINHESWDIFDIRNFECKSSIGHDTCIGRASYLHENCVIALMKTACLHLIHSILLRGLTGI